MEAFHVGNGPMVACLLMYKRKHFNHVIVFILTALPPPMFS
jgi:hypothetical protein